MITFILLQVIQLVCMDDIYCVSGHCAYAVHTHHCFVASSYLFYYFVCARCGAITEQPNNKSLFICFDFSFRSHGGRTQNRKQKTEQQKSGIVLRISWAALTSSNTDVYQNVIRNFAAAIFLYSTSELIRAQ